jgi:hypothetical protein
MSATKFPELMSLLAQTVATRYRPSGKHLMVIPSGCNDNDEKQAVFITKKRDNSSRWPLRLYYFVFCFKKCREFNSEGQLHESGFHFVGELVKERREHGGF